MNFSSWAEGSTNHQRVAKVALQCHEGLSRDSQDYGGHQLLGEPSSFDCRSMSVRYAHLLRLRPRLMVAEVDDRILFSDQYCVAMVCRVVRLDHQTG